MSRSSLWLFIFERIKQSKPVILLYVLESKGSSPGRQGFKMAVAADEIIGSIGGGVMEHKFVDQAKERLRSISNDAIVRKQVHNRSAKQDQSGMICSGEQTILFFHLKKDHSEVIKRIAENIEQERKIRLRITPFQISIIIDNDQDPDFSYVHRSEEDWEYEERIGLKNQLYIIGGGHCALAFSKLMSTMDFKIHLYDTRDFLNTFEQNSFVNEKKVIEHYSDLEHLIPSGNNIYVVIMTFGFATDDKAFRALINKDFRYIGVLGSQTKIAKLRDEWTIDNLPVDKLKNVHAPIGISIQSQTPEEIAVSIAAEIISVKNKT